MTALVEKTGAFTRDMVLPLEDEHDGDITAAGGDTLRVELQKAAKDAGVFAPHAPVEYGGHGLNMTDRAPVFEEAGYSLFGPMALNIAAPDEGNVHMLDAHRQPGAEGAVPRPAGARRHALGVRDDRAVPRSRVGSDSALTTRAEKVPGGWKINGHKYFITGADGAGFFIIFARTSGEPGDRGGATMFLTPADVTGLRVGRHIDTLDKSMIGGHCEVFFDDLFVPDSGVLGEVDQGFALRAGPARARPG